MAFPSIFTLCGSVEPGSARGLVAGWQHSRSVRTDDRDASDAICQLGARRSIDPDIGPIPNLLCTHRRSLESRLCSERRSNPSCSRHLARCFSIVGSAAYLAWLGPQHLCGSLFTSA
jgi:hypothetical protein